MAEKRTIELDVNSNLGSLKSQLKQAQQDVQTLSDKFGATSSQAVAAAKSAAILKDKIGDAKMLTDAFNPDAKFKSLSGSLTGVASGFSVATGAMGLFGKQNEDVEKALLKVQSAMALASGLQGIGESIDSFKQLKAVIVSSIVGITAAKSTELVATEAVVVAENQSFLVKGKNLVVSGLQATLTGVMTAAQYAYNLAMSLNPVGAIVLAVIALIAAGYALVKMFMSAEAANTSASNATKKNTDSLNKQIKSAERASEALATKNGHEYNMAKAAGASDEALRKLALRHADQTIALERSSVATARNTYEKQKNTLADYVAAGYSEEVITKQMELTKATRENLLKEKDDLQNAINAKLALIRDNEVAIATEKFNKQNEIKQAQIDANKKIVESNNEKNDKLKAQEEEYNQSIKNSKLLLLNNTLSQDQIEINAVKEKYQKQIDLAKSLKKDTAVIQDAMGLELHEIRKKYAVEEELMILKPLPVYKAANTELLGYVKTATDEEKKIKIDAELAVAEQKAAIQNQALDTAKQGVDLIKGLFEKSKGVQKAAVIAESAIGIAKMVIANNLANIAALATPQAIASSGVSAVPVIAMNNISTGIGIAANIAATAKALKTLGGGAAPTGGDTGGGGPTGGGGGGGGVVSPSFNVVGNNGFSQLAQLQQQPVQAYVVSGEVTTAQALDRNRITNATL